MARPADEEGRAEAALVDGALAAFHAAVPAIGIGAVVREVNDDGVVLEFQIVETFEDAADVPVDVFTHGQGGAGHHDVLALGIAVAHGGIDALEFVVEHGEFY